MRVLLAHTFYRSSAPSGEDAVYRDERKMLEENGTEVIPFEKYNDDLDDATLTKRIDIALTTAWSKRVYMEISELIRKTRPDVAHFHNTFPQMSSSVYLACQENKVPVVQTLHNFRFICPGAMLLRDGKPCESCIGTTLLPALRYRCYRGSLSATMALVWTISLNRWNGAYTKMINRYIALTEFAKGRLVAGGLPEHRIVVKPNLIVGPFEEVAKENYAVFVGRLKNEKGVKTLLAAWRQLPDVPLILIGDGELRGELEEYAKTHNLNIQFLGYRPRHEVLRYVSRARIQIIPSECYEGFPLVVLEAYAHGTPIVASRIGSLNELIVDGDTGMKFEAGNADDLAVAVKALWSSQLLKAMGKNARELVCARYSSKSNYEQLMNIYAEARADYAVSTI